MENFKKQEGKNGGKKKKRFPCTRRFPYSCVLHWLGTPSGYRPHVTLPQENPLAWEQQNPRIIDPSPPKTSSVLLVCTIKTQ
jgi:hypothetical protein